MSNKGIERPDHTVQVTHAMIDELDRHLGWRDKPRSYRLLMAVLHALWEWSSENEPTDLAADFPMRLCGTNYEQWPSSWTAIKSRGATDFFAHVDLGFRPGPLKDPPAAILACSISSPKGWAIKGSKTSTGCCRWNCSKRGHLRMASER